MPTGATPPPGPRELALTRILRDAMLERGWTRSEIARRTDISLAQVCDILANRKGPRSWQIFRMADALDMTLVELAERIEAVVAINSVPEDQEDSPRPPAGR